MRYDTVEEVEKVFMETCIQRYNLAKKAPVMNTLLASHEDVLQADYDYLISMIEGETELPKDLDEVTRAYLEEIVTMAGKNQVDPERKPELSRNHFCDFWRRVNEHTLSSASGLHYGTYKAAAKDEFVSEAQALQLTWLQEVGFIPNVGKWPSRCC